MCPNGPQGPAVASALLAEIGGKSDGPALGRGRVHELADRREDGGDGLYHGKRASVRAAVAGLIGVVSVKTAHGARN